MEGCFACLPSLGFGRPAERSTGSSDHERLMKKVSEKKLRRHQSVLLADDDTPDEIEKMIKLALEVLREHCPGAKIAVVGGGMYGCHHALSFAREGFQVDLYDKADELFSGASGHCAFRIHRGYHYPRSHKTRKMCSLDHDLFVRRYPNLVCKDDSAVEKAVLISNDGKSAIDYGTMQTIMTGVGLPMEEMDRQKLDSLGFDQVEGGFINKEEPILYVDYPREWFMQELQRAGVCIHLGERDGKVSSLEPVSKTQAGIRGKVFDFVVNCTYNQCFTYAPEDHKFVFEVCMSPVVAMKEGVEPLSFGVFDGPFPSLEPYLFKGAFPEKYAKYQGRRLFQIWHIALTAVCTFSTAEEAQAAMKRGVMSQKEVDERIARMLVDVRKYYPNFDKEYEVVGHNLALKTKANDSNAHRPLIVLQNEKLHPRLFTIISAKLSSIIHAQRDLLMLMLGEIRSNAAEPVLRKLATVYEIQKDSTQPQFNDPHAAERE